MDDAVGFEGLDVEEFVPESVTLDGELELSQVFFRETEDREVADEKVIADLLFVIGDDSGVTEGDKSFAWILPNLECPCICVNRSKEVGTPLILDLDELDLLET